jgi:hypothetical protein
LRSTVKTKPMRPSPETNAAGYPDVDGWEIYGLALQSAVGPAVSLEAADWLSAIDLDPKVELTGRPCGCDDDALI